MKSDNGQPKMPQIYRTSDVLAVAVAAYEYTDRRIVRAKIANGSEPNRRLITDYVEGRGAPFTVKIGRAHV